MIRKYMIVLLLPLVLLLSSCGWDKSQTLTNLDDYDVYLSHLKNSSDFMPKLDAIENELSIDVIYFHNRTFLVDEKTINLIVTYDVSNYESEKDKILQQNDFLMEPAKKHSLYVIPVVEFEYNEYTIKVVEHDSFVYPNWFGMIGYSDSKKKICYLYYYDIELDSVPNESKMIEFVMGSFKFD